MLIEAGELDRKIRLERATWTRDAGSGEQVPSWGLLKRVSAKWRPATSGREAVTAGEIASTVTDVFIIRWDTSWSDLNPKDGSFSTTAYTTSSRSGDCRRVGLNAPARTDKEASASA